MIYKGLKAGRENQFDRAARQQQQAIDSSTQQPQRQMPVHVEKKVGRNEFYKQLEAHGHKPAANGNDAKMFNLKLSE